MNYVTLSNLQLPNCVHIFATTVAFFEKMLSIRHKMLPAWINCRRYDVVTVPAKGVYSELCYHYWFVGVLYALLRACCEFCAAVSCVQVVLVLLSLCCVWQDMFVPFTIDSVVELTLGANQKLADAKRLQWNVKDFGLTAAGLSVISCY